MATKPVDQWTLSDAKSAAGDDLPADFEKDRLMVEDKDHWQNGSLWPGYRTGDGALDIAIINNIRPQFIADDITGECVQNRTAGLIGQEADVALVPLPAPGAAAPGATDPAEDLDESEREEVDGTLEALAAWWDRVGLWAVARQALDRLSYGGRTGARAFIPPGRLKGGTTLPPASDLPSALANIEIDCPALTSARRYVDPTTNAPSAIIITKVDDKEQAEVWTLDPTSEDGTINVRVLKAEGAGQQYALNLRGRLPLAVCKGPTIVNPTTRSLQSQVNFIATIVTRTAEMTGHRERYFSNMDPPGMWLPFPPTVGKALDVDDETSPKFWKHRVPMIVGANVTTEMVGIPQRTRQPDGTETEVLTTPTVTALDPVDPAWATNALANVTQRLYRRFHQGHLALDATAEASGIAYQQARAQFESDLKAVKGAVELMLRDLLESVLALAGLMHPASASLLDRFRVQVTLHVSAGPISAAEQTQAVALRDKRVISQERAMALCGIEDPAAETQAMDSDPITLAALWSTLKPALDQLLLVPGMTIQGAAWLLKLPVEVITVLVTGVPPEGALGPEIAPATAPARTDTTDEPGSAAGTPPGAPNGARAAPSGRPPANGRPGASPAPSGAAR